MLLREEVASALAAVDLAKSTAGKPGGATNLQAAEIRCGRLLAEHGATLLKALAEHERMRLRSAYVPSHR